MAAANTRLETERQATWRLRQSSLVFSSDCKMAANAFTETLQSLKESERI